MATGLSSAEVCANCWKDFCSVQSTPIVVKETLCKPSLHLECNHGPTNMFKVRVFAFHSRK